MVDWPASLPCPVADSAQWAPLFDNRIRSNVDWGIKDRPRFTFVPDVFSFQIKCSKAQLSTLLDFYRITLRESESFEWIEWRSALPQLQRYAFNKAPTYAKTGRKYLVDIELKTLRRYDGLTVLDIRGVEGYYAS